MKFKMASLILFSTCLIASAAELPGSGTDPLVKKLKSRTHIGAVNDTSIKNDAGVKCTVVKFYTYQDKREDDHGYAARVTVELADKEGNTYAGQAVKAQGGMPSNYTGEDDWSFEVSHGDLDKLKLTAYAVEYGMFESKTFVPIAQELKKAESAEEIMDRSTNRIQVRCTRHVYKYGAE